MRSSSRRRSERRPERRSKLRTRDEEWRRYEPDVDLYISLCYAVELPPEGADELEVRLPLTSFCWVNLTFWVRLAIGNMQFIAPRDEVGQAAGLALGTRSGRRASRVGAPRRPWYVRVAGVERIRLGEWEPCREQLWPGSSALRSSTSSSSLIRRLRSAATGAPPSSGSPRSTTGQSFVVTLLNGLTSSDGCSSLRAASRSSSGSCVVNMAHGAFYLVGGYVAYEVQQSMTGEGFSLSVGRGDHLGVDLPRPRRLPWLTAAGLFVQQVFLRWNSRSRQALITIALSVIIADQIIAHLLATFRRAWQFGGNAAAWPAAWLGEHPHELPVLGIEYLLARLIVLFLGVMVGVSSLALAPPTRRPGW